MSGIVGMSQLGDRHPLDFVLGPAEERGPGRVDAEEIALEVGDAKQVLRDVPDAVTFYGALGDLRFQRVVENLQRLLLADALGGFDARRENATNAARRRLVGNRAVADRKSRVFYGRPRATYGP